MERGVRKAQVLAPHPPPPVARTHPHPLCSLPASLPTSSTRAPSSSSLSGGGMARRAFAICRMKGRPSPSMRTSMSSRPAHRAGGRAGRPRASGRCMPANRRPQHRRCPRAWGVGACLAPPRQGGEAAGEPNRGCAEAGNRPWQLALATGTACTKQQAQIQVFSACAPAETRVKLSAWKAGSTACSIASCGKRQQNEAAAGPVAVSTAPKTQEACTAYCKQKTQRRTSAASCSGSGLQSLHKHAPLPIRSPCPCRPPAPSAALCAPHLHRALALALPINDPG